MPSGLGGLLCWSPTLKIVACAFHGVAIACTVFRLMYRWYTAHFWWEDGWAAFALTVDVPCLVSASLEAAPAQGTVPPVDRITNWITQLGFTTVLWSCRMSILSSIVRVANPGRPLRRIAYLVGGSFFVMWAALMVQKTLNCLNTCVMHAPEALSQILTNVVADAALVGLPVWFFRRQRITRRQRIMLFPVYSASLLITVVTIFHSIVLFVVQSNGIIVIGHVKIALALIVCNLLVIVTFAYRVCRRRQQQRGGMAGGDDLDATTSGIASFTNVDLNTGFTAESDATSVDSKQTYEPPLVSDGSGDSGVASFSERTTSTPTTTTTNEI